MTQLLQVFSRQQFHEAVRQEKAERHARGFASWDHFVAMLFCQLADAQSLREITGGLSSCEGRLEQFGMRVPKRSTLSYANNHRPWELFRTVFYNLAEQCRTQLGQKTKFRFQNRLLSIDSTVVTLCLKMLPWATWSRQKGAVKLHLTLDHAGYLPEAAVITTGKYSERTVAQRRRYARGTILIMDRGFADFRWFNQLDGSGVFFVTRIKKDAPYTVVQSDPVAPGKNLISDERIQLTGKRTRKRYPQQIRLVTIQNDEGERLQLLTNQRTLAAATIADIYKDRWQIEIFFKLVKQNLRIKSFVGTSANAVWTQIWTAMIAMLVVKFLQLKAQFGWSFSNLVYFLRMNLLVYRDLWDWLNEPFTSPQSEPPAAQLELPWG
jgi:hypothetical protein